MEKPKCTVECEDCGKFALMNDEALSIFLIDRDFIGMTKCIFCDRIISNNLTKIVALKLFWHGIKVFNFNTGELITDQGIFDKL